MINVDYMKYIHDRMWFGWYYMAPPEPYDPLSLDEVFTFHASYGWRRAKFRRWVIVDLRLDVTELYHD